MTIAKVTTSLYFSGVGMTKEKAKEVIEKVELSNVGNTKPPQWDGKKGNSCRTPVRIMVGMRG